MKYINYTDDVNLSLYESEYISLFNEYNNETLNILENIKKLLKKSYFEVPYYIKEMVWGKEKIYYPFTSKLYKIVSTDINDTSIQLHPLKNEVWYLIKDSSIYNGFEWKKIKKGSKITIPSNSVHCMKKNGQVFEVQNNDVFNREETIRLFDLNGRKISDKNSILKQLMPNIRNEIIINEKFENNFKNKDLFLYILEGKASILIGNKIHELENNKLYYVKKELLKNISILGIAIIDEAEYYDL